MVDGKQGAGLELHYELVSMLPTLVHFEWRHGFYTVHSDPLFEKKKKKITFVVEVWGAEMNPAGGNVSSCGG